MSRIFISGIFSFGDLGGFCNLWLKTGRVLNADFKGINGVDFQDFRMVGELRRRLYPAGRPPEDLLHKV